ncbi:hypothetical protein F0L17_14145 [Streptomyces sp. TRM43335]|uniref:Uncharacterized protein n=1 Tax=Streptomyces taklimakanensis TaxID=2569853 RepID=A0A6G2BD98_9ACTN|nr:hypothetical protein [Streptomyces taklimakanensis]MTE20228.1 hypothetical protein [Streptomyces taklimakanensis]
MTSYSGLTARDVPEARQDLIDWSTGPGERVFAQRGRPELSGALAASATHAELFYITADMASLARTIGQGLDVYALAADDLPAPHGLLVWDGPASSEHAGAAPTAVAWMSNGGRLFVSLLVPAAAYRNWCASHSLEAARSAPSVTAGRLVYRGHGPRLLLDGPDTPWERLGCGPDEETIRTLLATFILIRQPVEARRSLHEVEDVLPSRASQKRIRRAGGDPTQAVRYVTLRQSLRPEGGGHDAGEHARRIYRHRWFVKAHRARQYYPSRGEHQTIWRGPYLVVPAGCEDAPILGGERVNVLRR